MTLAFAAPAPVSPVQHNRSEEYLAVGGSKGRRSSKIPRNPLRKGKEPKHRSDPPELRGQPLRRDCGSLRCPPRLRSGSRTKQATHRRVAPRVGKRPCCGHRPKPAVRRFDTGEATESDL